MSVANEFLNCTLLETCLQFVLLVEYQMSNTQSEKRL